MPRRFSFALHEALCQAGRLLAKARPHGRLLRWPGDADLEVPDVVRPTAELDAAHGRTLSVSAVRAALLQGLHPAIQAAAREQTGARELIEPTPHLRALAYEALIDVVSTLQQVTVVGPQGAGTTTRDWAEAGLLRGGTSRLLKAVQAGLVGAARARKPGDQLSLQPHDLALIKGLISRVAEAHGDTGHTMFMANLVLRELAHDEVSLSGPVVAAEARLHLLRSRQRASWGFAHAIVPEEEAPLRLEPDGTVTLAAPSVLRVWRQPVSQRSGSQERVIGADLQLGANSVFFWTGEAVPAFEMGATDGHATN